MFLIFLLLYIDAEFEVVVMANRHTPAKCIALGMWDNPGEENCFFLSAFFVFSTAILFPLEQFRLCLNSAILFVSKKSLIVQLYN